MSTITQIFSYISAAFGAFAGYFFGGFDGFLIALLSFVVIDYITGIMVAIINKELSSEVGFKGIFKKVLIFFLVGVAHLLDTQILGGDGSVLRTAVIFFYLSNEGVSILENVAVLGLPVPEKIQEVLAQLTTETEKDEDIDDDNN